MGLELTDVLFSCSAIAQYVVELLTQISSRFHKLMFSVCQHVNTSQWIWRESNPRVQISHNKCYNHTILKDGSLLGPTDFSDDYSTTSLS